MMSIFGSLAIEAGASCVETESREYCLADAWAEARELFWRAVMV
jgi:hypothetical protein